MTNDDHLNAIEDIEENEGQLSAWERNFIDSIKSRLMDGRTLTEPQVNKLEQIWERVTS